MAKRKKVKTDNSNTGAIVLTAIKKLTRSTGWTARTIVKFIKMEYKLNDDKLSQKVSRALKRGVRLGLLHAISGRYRLNDMSRLAQVDSSVIQQKQAGGRRQRYRPLTIRSRSASNER